MEQFNIRRDGYVVALFVLMVVMLVAGLSADRPGAYQVFGYALIGYIGVSLGLGYVRSGRPITWVPPVVATAILLVSLIGMFAYQSVPVNTPGDAVMGFQKGTAFLIYGLWVPAFFTLSLGFVWVFDHLIDRPASGQGGQR
jgi:hypothetical protein